MTTLDQMYRDRHIIKETAQALNTRHAHTDSHSAT